MADRTTGRVACTLGASVVGLGLLATTASAATFDSTTEEFIRTLDQQLLYIAVPISLLVEAILLYTVYRFRNADAPVPTRENRRLEITWTVATALVLLFVGVASYQVLVHPSITAAPDETARDLPEDAVTVSVTGQQFAWTVEYPEENVSSTATMVLPVNRTAVLEVTSTDVVHSVHVPDLGIKQDAIPGQDNYVRTEPTTEGNYTLFCAEYCGNAHSIMLGEIRVVSDEEYESWLDEQRSASLAGPAGAAGDRSAGPPEVSP